MHLHVMFLARGACMFNKNENIYYKSSHDPT